MCCRPRKSVRNRGIELGTDGARARNETEGWGSRGQRAKKKLKTA